MTLQELYDKRAKAWEAAKAFLDSKNGTLSGEDKAAYERMENELSELTESIQREQRLENMRREMEQPVNMPLLGRPNAGTEEQKTGRASRQYATDFVTGLRSNFKKITDVLEEGTDSAGGYLVPAEWDSRLIDAIDGENVMRGLATVIKTSGEHKINIAGVKPTASWIDEGEALSFGETGTFGQKVLDAHKLHAAIKVTEELLYDAAYNIEQYIIDQAGKALGNGEEEAFMVGNGSGKPTGIFDATNGGALGVTTAALKADNIVDLIYSLKRPYRKNASFVMKDATIAAVRKFKDGNGAYMWQPSYLAGEPDKLCGYNINPSEYAPDATSGNTPIAFGDFSYYNIGDRGVRSVQILRELFAGNGMVGYVVKERVDGILVLKEAVQLLKVQA